MKTVDKLEYKISKIMETKICLFNQKPITFVIGKDNKMMINATEMAKIFGRKVEAFMRNETTIQFVNEALKSENSRFLNVFSQSDLYYSVPKAGTWMHKILALKFAAWLSPSFELWVYSTIDKILFGKYEERDRSFQRTLAFQKEMDALKIKSNKTGEDFTKYLQLEKNLKKEKALRKSLTSETVSGMKLLFE